MSVADEGDPESSLGVSRRYEKKAGPTQMRIPLLAVAAAVLTALLFSPVAEAKRVPCVVGTKSPKCLVWDAKVRLGDDGDTVKAAIKKGGHYAKPDLVRFTGIQAMELFNYSRNSRKGACMGVPATIALEKMVKNSTRSPGRAEGEQQVDRRHACALAPLVPGQEGRPVDRPRRRAPEARPCAAVPERRRVGVERHLQEARPGGGREGQGPLESGRHAGSRARRSRTRSP